ncbi:UNVERIFIED_CONTAM: hypothetical protein Slati_1701800 [Sesamum latifolium]|uniref:Uncharacterized protein n=1 Tax=Sesamum latifolium TaxID=2727402 RepID=A0AAW2WXS3_9LAMI
MAIRLGGFNLEEAKGKDAERRMRKNDEVETTAASALSAPIASLGQGKKMERWFGSQQLRTIFA